MHCDTRTCEPWRSTPYRIGNRNVAIPGNVVRGLPRVIGRGGPHAPDRTGSSTVALATPARQGGTVGCPAETGGFCAHLHGGDPGTARDWSVRGMQVVSNEIRVDCRPVLGEVWVTCGSAFRSVSGTSRVGDVVVLPPGPPEIPVFTGNGDRGRGIRAGLVLSWEATGIGNGWADVPVQAPFLMVRMHRNRISAVVALQVQDANPHGQNAKEQDLSGCRPTRPGLKSSQPESCRTGYPGEGSCKPRVQFLRVSLSALTR